MFSFEKARFVFQLLDASEQIQSLDADPVRIGRRLKVEQASHLFAPMIVFIVS